MIDLSDRRVFAFLLGGFGTHDDRRPGIRPLRHFAFAFPRPDPFDCRQWTTPARLAYDAVLLTEIEPGWWACEHIPEDNPVLLLARDELE